MASAFGPLRVAAAWSEKQNLQMALQSPLATSARSPPCSSCWPCPLFGLFELQACHRRQKGRMQSAGSVRAKPRRLAGLGARWLGFTSALIVRALRDRAAGRGADLHRTDRRRCARSSIPLFALGLGKGIP